LDGSSLREIPRNARNSRADPARLRSDESASAG